MILREAQRALQVAPLWTGNACLLSTVTA